MNKTWQIYRFEIRSVVLRRSFLLSLILIPLLPMIIFWFASTASDEQALPGPVNTLITGGQEYKMEGVVDHSGIIRAIEPQINNSLALFTDEAAARKALEDGTLESFAVIPENYLETGVIHVYRKDYNPLQGFNSTDSLLRTLNYNLLDGNSDLIERIETPLNLEVEYSRDPGAGSRNLGNPDNFMVPYIVAILFYTIIFGSASLMLNSVTAEKQNRTIEMLVTSVSPVQLLTGKIVALGCAGLAQTVVWGGFGILFYRNREMIAPQAGQNIDPGILAWGIGFYILGYALYASLMAGIGALVPGIREASQVTTVLIFPLLLPILFISVLARNPNGALSTGLSLFPFTSPVTMMMRLAVAEVPAWQPLFAALLLAGTAVLAVRSAAGMFRAQNLLTGRPINISTFVRALFARA